MFALFGARPAAVDSARERHSIFNLFRRLATLAAAAGALAACQPATVPIAGRDPADPAAKVARLGYSATTAPYTSMRPQAPAPWRERNGSVAPQPKSDE
jgi:hypothetical protein